MNSGRLPIFMGAWFLEVKNDMFEPYMPMVPWTVSWKYLVRDVEPP